MTFSNVRNMNKNNHFNIQIGLGETYSDRVALKVSKGVCLGSLTLNRMTGCLSLQYRLWRFE